MCLVDLFLKKLEANIPDNNAFREWYDFNNWKKMFLVIIIINYMNNML